MESTIFFGNGFNLLSKNQPSWDGLLKEISDKDFDGKIPNTMKYEAIIAQKPFTERGYLLFNDGSRILLNDGSRLVYEQHAENSMKDKLAERMKQMPSNRFYELLLDMPVVNYITTNYDNVLIRGFKGKHVKGHKPENLYSLRRFYEFGDVQLDRRLWPIHGCYESPKSIMLGLDQYCGSIGKINDYVKGQAEIDGVRIKKIEERLQESIPTVFSWIDLLFTTDVHIIGFGLPYEEVDIWWLLDRRMRLIRKGGVDPLVRNKIFYYSTAASSKDFTPDKRQCLQAYGVEIVEPKRYSQNFESQFTYLLKAMKKNIINRAGA